MKNNPRKVLITGGLGFIGSNLAIKCQELGMDVTVLDNLDSYSGGNPINLDNYTADIRIVSGDILDYELLTQMILDKDLIFNCAASTSHGYSMREPWLHSDVNSRGVINLLEAIKQRNRDAALVHLGTTTQLGPLQYRPADENHPEFPTDLYSANKMVSEKYVLIYAKAYGLNATVIRLPNVFGPRAAIHSADFAFNNYFVGLALQDKQITVYRPGDQLRNVLYVDDAVSALLAVTESPESVGETFFATGDEHYSVKTIAERTCQVLGGSVKMVEWPKTKKAIDVGDAVITNAKIKRVLGWAPCITLDEGLVRTKRYFQNRLGSYL